MSLFSKGLPNFNQLIADNNTIDSRKSLEKVLTADSDKNCQKFIVEPFANDSCDTIHAYVKKQIDYIETAINNNVAFTFTFLKTSNKGKKPVYGLPHSSIEKTDKEGTSNTLMFMNILYELDGILNDQKKLVLRDIYYKNVHIYGKSQGNFNHMFEKFLSTLGVDRQEFNVGAAQKGEYYSHQNLMIKHNTNCDVLVQGKHLIPNNDYYKCAEKNTIMNVETPLNLLIVEKDAVFSDIIDNVPPQYLKNWVIVTGRGQPDFLTLNFVSGLSSCKQIGKVFILTDLDPYGIYIGLNYMNTILDFTKQNLLFKRESSMNYLGVKLYDIFSNKQNILNNENVNKILISYQIKDYRIATNCVKKLASNPYIDSCDPVKDLLMETQRQIFFGFKVEINSLNDGNVCSWMKEKLASID